MPSILLKYRKARKRKGKMKNQTHTLKLSVSVFFLPPFKHEFKLQTLLQSSTNSLVLYHGSYSLQPHKEDKKKKQNKTTHHPNKPNQEIEKEQKVVFLLFHRHW